MSRAEKRPGPPKGTKPDFSGVPGEIVSLDKLPVLDFARKARCSPYDALLDKLLDAPKNSVLKFGEAKARMSIAVRARKKGLKIEFAESGGALYVRIVGFTDDQPAKPNAAAEPNAKDAMHVLRAMAAGFAAPVTISDHVLKAGVELGPSRVLEVLQRLEAAGSVRQLKIDGSWHLTAKAG